MAQPPGPPTADLESLAKALSNSPEFRVLRRIHVPPRYRTRTTADFKIGMVLDVEATGLDLQRDRVIELAFIRFEYESTTGEVFDVLDSYDGLQDPGEPLTPEIARLTGLSDADLSGQALDIPRIEEALASTNLVIAHNAAFDRPMVERIIPKFAKRAWLCSQNDFPWEELGFTSKKLEYLAMSLGWFYPPHRALADVNAVLHLLATTQHEGRVLFREALAKAKRTTNRIWAIGSPFESKDLLKARGYRWNDGVNGKPKSWYRDIDEEAFIEELAVLYSQVYRKPAAVRLDRITAMTRFSARDGDVEEIAIRTPD